MSISEIKVMIEIVELYCKYIIIYKIFYKIL